MRSYERTQRDPLRLRLHESSALGAAIRPREPVCFPRCWDDRPQAWVAELDLDRRHGLQPTAGMWSRRGMYSDFEGVCRGDVDASASST